MSVLTRRNQSSLTSSIFTFILPSQLEWGSRHAFCRNTAKLITGASTSSSLNSLKIPSNLKTSKLSSSNGKKYHTSHLLNCIHLNTSSLILKNLIFMKEKHSKKPSKSSLNIFLNKLQRSSNIQTSRTNILKGMKI